MQDTRKNSSRTGKGMASNRAKSVFIDECRFRSGKLTASLVCLGSILCSVIVLSACDHRQRIVVGCKNFTEQIILGELIAQQIENEAHLSVERRFYLGGTYIAHQGILAG